MTIFLPKKNDRFKTIHKLHNYCYGDGWIFVCLGWTQTYIPKGRRKKAQPRFCEAMPESKLTLPKKLQTADFKLDRSVWCFEPVEPKTEAPASH